jgi:tetratricopeptide (TPR) repeat protein
MVLKAKRSETGDAYQGGDMAKKKRVTRKQLLREPDEFLTFSAKMIQFATENQKQISYALIGLLVVVLAFAAIRYFSNLSDRRAYAVFEEGLVHYLSQAPGDKSSHFQGVAKEKFAQVLAEYSSTSAARLSLPLYADISYTEGSYDKAIELYQKALKAFSEEDSLRTLIWNGLAYAYEGKQEYSGAAECFRKITEFKGEFVKSDAYFNLGRMYEALGNREKALEAYDKVVKDYPESVHFQIAKEKVQQLQG